MRTGLILALAVWAAPASADIDTGLIARFAMDGNAQDSSPYANHGTANANMVLTTDRFGTPNGAYEFNGTNSSITVPNSASLASPTTAITMAAWIQLYGSSKVGADFAPILMKSVTGENGFMYRMNAHPTYFGSAYNDWNTHQSAAATLAATDWHHVATTFDGTLHKFYLDGVQVSELPLSLTIAADTRPLSIGYDSPGQPEYFWGKMDEVRIYARALGPADIAELYAFLPVDAGRGPGRGLAISRVFPMPARGAVRLDYSLPGSAPATLEIVDVRGRSVRSYSLGVVPAGSHSVVWEDRAPAGVYFARLRTSQGQALARVVRL